ncbi:phospholipase A [Saccharobesus litoralis]|uniref:phospholipase A n=1 Tax=Saccharobesus litoralis TaxID=2172099 RepID=UPI00131F42EC|nr:phospholipase A [Saccharobesus litoralis]
MKQSIQTLLLMLQLVITMPISAQLFIDSDAGGSFIADRDYPVIDSSSASDLYSLQHHQGSFVLPVTYNVDQQQKNTEKLESKFQLSIKTALLDNPFEFNGNAENNRVYFAYTQTHFWQSYNDSASTPVRETHYQPEVIWRFSPSNFSLLGIPISHLELGLNHKSTGEQPPYSRNWNRFIVNLISHRAGWQYNFKTWYSQPQKHKTISYDDNYGRAEFGIKHFAANRTIGLQASNALTGDYKGLLTIEYSQKLFNQIALYVEYKSGYGESMVDYATKVNQIGIGFSVVDWL